MILLRDESVKFRATFLGFDNIAEDQDEVIFTVYDKKYQKQSETVLPEISKISTGTYIHIISFAEQGIYFYEFRGLKNGIKSLIRERIEVTFIN